MFTSSSNGGVTLKEGMNRNWRDRPEEILEITVGPQQERFQVHKSILREKSLYFKNLLENHNHFHGVTHLQGADPRVFKELVYWMYSGSFSTAVRTIPHFYGAAPLKSVSYNLLADLYIHGDSLGIPALQNQVIDTILDNLDGGKTISVDTIAYVYESTPPGSKLGELFVGIFVYKAAQEPDFFLSEYRREHFSQGFLFDVAKEFAKQAHRQTLTTDMFGDRALYYI